MDVSALSILQVCNTGEQTVTTSPNSIYLHKYFHTSLLCGLFVCLLLFIDDILVMIYLSPIYVHFYHMQV